VKPNVKELRLAVVEQNLVEYRPPSFPSSGAGSYPRKDVLREPKPIGWAQMTQQPQQPQQPQWTRLEPTLFG
jgi:hypothetical protein